MATGIADYSFELLPLVASSADVVAVCPRPRRFRPVRTPLGVPVVTPDRFAKQDGADANVYHLGNNPYHEFVYRAAMAEPGITVFHDFVMHHLLAAVTIEQHRDAPQYRRILESEYGAVGTRIAGLRERRVATEFEKFVFPLSGHVARASRAIVVHSEDARARMAELAPGVPIAIIPAHGGSPPASVAGLTRAAARAALGLAPDAFVVGHFGFITRPKQPAAVVGGFARLAAAHPDAVLMMVGADHTGGGLDRLIAQHRLEGRVRVAGFVGLPEFYRYLRACDVMVSLRYPSAGETSAVVARALAEGRATIVNNLQAFAELPDDVALKVEIDEDQAASLGEHLVRLAGEPALRARLGAGAKRYATEVLDPARCAEQYVAFAAAVARSPRTVTMVREPARGPATQPPESLAPLLASLEAGPMTHAGSAVHVDLLYRLLLRREPGEEALRSATRALAAGETTWAELARWIVTSREYRELELIEGTLARLRREPGPFRIGEDGGFGPDTTERVVEIPWAISRWDGAGRVLDLGYAFAPRVYLSALTALPAREVHGVDHESAPVGSLRRTRADLRALPYRDGSFDLAICISTIEHIGMDNTRYGITGDGPGEAADAATLHEIERVLAPGGRALLTVPFGRREDHGWFRQYDEAAWSALLRSSDLRPEAEDAYVLEDRGWRPADRRTLSGISYGDGVPAARAVLCAELRKPLA
ncbi:MAG: glycosyltransferase [Actinobacteria bacterium]|nr:MAG: glycosyltransferase [Actinomycetota bacterium]